MYVVRTADIVLVREVSFIESVLYIEVTLYVHMYVRTCLPYAVVLYCGPVWHISPDLGRRRKRGFISKGGRPVRKQGKR